MDILNKNQYLRLWQGGQLGNKLRSWLTYGAIIKDNYNGLVVIRCIEANSTACRYTVPVDQVLNMIQEMSQYTIDSFYFNESAPDDKLQIQGEVIQSERHIELFYSHLTLPMRQALAKDGRHQHGSSAVAILKYYLDPSSYDDLNLLMDLYPDHAIEFSCYRINLGHIPYRNTVIWEVRKY